MQPRLTTAELTAYLDESLAPDEMATIEAMLREQPALLEQLAELAAKRDAGVHSLGEIWRRRRLSCPPRDELGRHLLGALDDDRSKYIDFHLKTIGCRTCLANMADLERAASESPESSKQRRTKFFHSSAGQLRKKRDSTR